MTFLGLRVYRLQFRFWYALYAHQIAGMIRLFLYLIDSIWMRCIRCIRVNSGKASPKTKTYYQIQQRAKEWIKRNTNKFVTKWIWKMENYAFEFHNNKENETCLVFRSRGVPISVFRCVFVRNCMQCFSIFLHHSKSEDNSCATGKTEDQKRMTTNIKYEMVRDTVKLNVLALQCDECHFALSFCRNMKYIHVKATGHKI